MASSQEDACSISPVVDYICVVLRLRGPTTLLQIFNYIQISPYRIEVGDSVEQVERFLLSHPRHFRFKEDHKNILGFGDTDNDSNRSVCIKTIYPTYEYDINNIQISQSNDGLITTDGVAYWSEQQFPTVNIEFENRAVSVVSDLEKSQISFVYEAKSKQHHTTTKPHTDQETNQITTATKPNQTSQLNQPINQTTTTTIPNQISQPNQPTNQTTTRPNQTIQLIPNNQTNQQHQTNNIQTSSKQISYTGASVSSNLASNLTCPDGSITTCPPMTAPDRFDILEGVNILQEALLKNGPLPVRRLVGYLANVRKPVRDAVGKNREELLQFVLADDRFVVTGEDNLVYIKTVIINSGSAERSESSIRSQDTNSSSSTSVKFSRSEMSQLIAGMNDLPRPLLTKQELDRLEGIRILTKALIRNGPLQVSSLLGNLSQTTQDVRDAMGGSLGSIQDFLKNDNHFIVIESDGKCIVHLNPHFNSKPHPNDLVVERKSIENLSNFDSLNCDRRTAMSKSVKGESDIGYLKSRILPSSSPNPIGLEYKDSVENRFKIQITQMATITMLSKNGNTGFALFDNGEKVYISIRHLKHDGQKPLTNLNERFSVEDRVCIRACIGDSSGSCVWQALQITRKVENVNNSVQRVNQGNTKTGIQSKSQRIQQSSSLQYYDALSEENINIEEESNIECFKSGILPSSNFDPIGLEFEESAEDHSEIQIMQMATITKLSNNGRSGFALFDNGENIFIGVGFLTLDDHTITNLNHSFLVNDRVFIHACLGARFGSCKWKAIQISQKLKNVNNLVEAVNLSNSETSIRTKSQTFSQSNSLQSTGLTFENSHFASSVVSPTTACSVSSSIENGAEFFETNSSEQEYPESEGVNILLYVLSERGPLPAANLFGYLSKTSKSVREAIGRNPKELLQYLMNSEYFFVRGSNNLVHINTDRVDCFWSRESSYETEAVVDEVQTMPTRTLKNMQLSAPKSDVEIESSNSNSKQWHTTNFNSDITASSRAGVDFLKKILSETEYMPLETVKFIILNCCKPICDSFGENACMLLEFLRHDEEFVIEEEDQVVRMRTRSDEHLTCSFDARSMSEERASDEQASQEVQDSCSSNISETIALDFNRVKMIAMIHIIGHITLFDPISVDDLELLPIEDELFGESTLPQVLALRNGDGVDPFLRGKCLIRDFIARQKDVFCIIDNVVYLFNSSDYSKAFRASISSKTLDKQKSMHRSELHRNIFTLPSSAEASVQYQRKEKIVQEPEIYLSSNGQYLTILPDVEHTTVKTLALQFILTVLEMHGSVTISVLQEYEYLASREVQELLGKNSSNGNFTKKCVQEFCGDFSEALRYNKRAKTISLIETTSAIETKSFKISDSYDNSFVKDDTVRSDDARSLSKNAFTQEIYKDSCSSNISKTISPDLADIESFTSKDNETTIKKSVENVSCYSTESSAQLLREVSARENISTVVTGDEEKEISIDSLALQFIANVIQMHGPVSVKVLRKFEGWASREVQQLLGKSDEKVSISKECVKIFCRNHSEVLSYVEETKLISLSKSTSLKDNHNAMHERNANVSDPNAVREVAKSESIETAPTYFEPIKIDDCSMADSTRVENLSAETSGLRFLIALINEYGPLSIKAVNDHWPNASPIVRQCFGKASNSGYLGSKQLKEFCEKHCDIFNYTKKIVSLVDSFSSYVKVFRTDSNHDVGCVTNTEAISSIATNSSDDNVTLTFDKKMHNEEQRLYPTMNSSRKTVSLIEEKSLNCVKGIIQGFGPVCVNTLKQLLLGTKWGRKAAPSDVLTYLSRTPDVDSLTNTKVADFIMKHNDEFDIQDSKVYLVDSKQYAAWISDDAHEKTLTRTESSSLSFITSSNIGSGLQIQGEVKTKFIQAASQKHNVQVERAAVSTDQHWTTDSIENNPVEMSALRFLTSLIETVGPVSFSILNDSRNIASPEIRRLFGETSEKSNLKEKRLRRFCERHRDILNYTKKAVSLVDSNTPLVNSVLNDAMYNSESITNTPPTSQVAEISKSDVEFLTSKTELQREDQKQHQNDINSIKDINSMEQNYTNKLFLKNTEEVNRAVVSNDDDCQRSEDTPGREENTLLEMSVLKFVVPLIRAVGPLSFSALDDVLDAASSGIRQCLRDDPKTCSLNEAKLKQFCEKYRDVLQYNNLTVSLVDYSAYKNIIKTNAADQTAPKHSHSIKKAKRVMNTVSKSMIDSANASGDSTAKPEVHPMNQTKLLKDNSFTADSSIIERKSIRCVSGILRGTGPIYVSRLKQLLLGQAWAKRSAPMDVLFHLCQTIDINLLTTKKVTDFILEHGDQFDIQERKVYLVNSQQYVALMAEELRQDSLSRTDASSTSSLSLDNIRNTEADLVEESVLNFLVELLRSRGRISFLSIHCCRKFAPAEVRQCFGVTSESPVFKKVKIIEFCDRHRDVLDYSESEIYLVHSISENKSPVFEGALSASIDEQNSTNEINEIPANIIAELLADSNSIIQLQHHEAILQEMLSTVVATSDCNFQLKTFPEEVKFNSVPAVSCKNSPLEDASAVDTDLELKALTCIQRIIKKYGPIYFKSLKPLLLGRKYGQVASPLDVLIYLSGSDNVESLTPGKLKEFILRHSDHIAKHDGKVYLVNSSQKASQIIQKQHQESILQEMLSATDATSDGNCQMVTFPEKVEVNFVRNMLHENTHEDSGVMVFSDSSEACSKNDNSSDSTVENLALEFLVRFIRSYESVTFSTLSNCRHLASPEVQQLFGASRSRPFLNRNKLREFCQRHSDVLCATHKLEISFAGKTTNQCATPLEHSANSAQYAKKSEAQSLSTPNRPEIKSKRKTVTTDDSLRMSPVIDESYEYDLMARNRTSGSLYSSSFESSFNLMDSTSIGFDESSVEDVLPADVLSAVEFNGRRSV